MQSSPNDPDNFQHGQEISFGSDCQTEGAMGNNRYTVYGQFDGDGYLRALLDVATPQELNIKGAMRYFTPEGVVRCISNSVISKLGIVDIPVNEDVTVPNGVQQ